MKKFKKEHPGLLLSNKDIRKIVDTFHQLCKNVITETRDGLELPEQLGTLTLTRCKPSKANPLLNKKSRIFTSRFPIPDWLCKIAYSNKSSKYKFKNAQFWAFEAGRPFKKQASENFSKSHTKYVVSDNSKRLRMEYHEVNNKLKPIVRENLRKQKEEENHD